MEGKLLGVVKANWWSNAFAASEAKVMSAVKRRCPFAALFVSLCNSGPRTDTPRVEGDGVGVLKGEPVTALALNKATFVGPAVGFAEELDAVLDGHDAVPLLPQLYT